MESHTSSRTSSPDPTVGDASGLKPEVQAVLDTLPADQQQALLAALLGPGATSAAELAHALDDQLRAEEEERMARLHDRRSTLFGGAHGDIKFTVPTAAPSVCRSPTFPNIFGTCPMLSRLLRRAPTTTTDDW